MRSKIKISSSQQVARKLKIRFRRAALLEAALSHPSFRNEGPRLKLEDFDRLEFFGDSVINYIICLKLYKMFPEADEGELSKLRSILVSRKVLFRLTKSTGLLQFMRFGRSLSGQPEREKIKVYADAFEAFIGALFFDQGLKKTSDFISKVFLPFMNPQKLYRLDPNPKSTLQEVVLKKWKVLPVYQLEPLKDAKFKTTVSATNRLKAAAIGRSRQESEEKAAGLLVRKIRQFFLKSSKRASSRKKLRKAP
ncbi:MAG: ribonuclease III [Candidatus Omnitrophica bacterium]|nr:ribonuclease III [Candidatus Omnitrophota bacterium]